MRVCLLQSWKTLLDAGSLRWFKLVRNSISECLRDLADRSLLHRMMDRRSVQVAGDGVGTAIAPARCKWRVIAWSDLADRSVPSDRGATRNAKLISRRDYRRRSRPSQTLNWNRGSLSVTLVRAPMCSGLIRGEISIVNWQRTCDPPTSLFVRRGRRDSKPEGRPAEPQPKEAQVAWCREPSTRSRPEVGRTVEQVP